MEFDYRSTPAGLEVVLSGTLTLRDHDEFRDIVALVPTSGADICVLDLTKLDFVDSAGLGMFLVVREAAACNRMRVVLRRPTPQVRRLLEVARFDTLFTIDG